MANDLPASLCSPAHPLHGQWRALLGLLQAGQPAGRGLGEQDSQRAAAQLLLEVVLRQLGRVERLQLDGEGNIHARCLAGRRCRWVFVDGRLATAYRVDEVTRALDEARLAWAIPLPGRALESGPAAPALHRR